MKVEIKTSSGMPCSLDSFTINGIDADTDDFGDCYDQGQTNEPYCCANMKFEPKLPEEYIIEKYNITIDEYSNVCDILYDKLHVGYCCRCS